MTRSELERFQEYLMQTPDHKKLGILLTTFTGIRVGELCALRLSDFDMDRKTFKIRHTLQRIKDTAPNAPTKTKIIIDTPKSEKSKREIPIPIPILEVIDQLKFTNPNAYVLTGTAKYIEPRVFSDILKKHLKEAGLQEVNPHLLRHSFATLALHEGFPLKELSEILGHSNEQFTIARYVHSNMQTKRESMDNFTSA